MGYCSLCAILLPVARLADQEMLSLEPSYRHEGLGEGLTLAATSSEHIYPAVSGNPSVWLVLLKGSDILEKVAGVHELRITL